MCKRGARTTRGRWAQPLCALAAIGLGLGASATPVRGDECLGAETKVVPPPASDSGEFGHAISVSREVMAVGARFDDTSGVLAGAAYVYRYDEGMKAWGAPVKFTPGSAGDQVGFSIAVSGNVLAVGARRDGDNGNDAGAVYAYRYDLLGRTWEGPVKLAPGAADDQVGFSVAASGDVIVTGAKGDDDGGPGAGAVYVYRYDHDARTWGAPDKLTPGMAFDEAGWSVAIDGDTLVVGALLDDDSGVDAGAVYVYRYDDGAKTWGTPVKLAPPPKSGADHYGHSVSVSGDVLVVGAHLDDDSGLDAGAAYAYRYDSGEETWGAPVKFTPGAAGDDFGWSVAVDGNFIAIGAYADAMVGVDAGAVYTYQYDVGAKSWGFPTIMRPAAPGDQYGFSIGVSGDVMAVGARFDDESGNLAGAAYTYGCPDIPLLADLDGDGAVTFGDLVILLGLWGPCEGCPADLDGDGAVTFTDLLILLSRWS